MSYAAIIDSPLRRQIGAREFASTFGTNVAIQLCTIIQGILLARLLGPTGRGQFAAASRWPMLFAGGGGMGLTVALARRSAHVQDPSQIMRTGLILSLATGTFATLCCILAMPSLMANVDAVSRASAWYFLPFILMNHVALAFVAIDHGAARFTSFNWTRLVLNPVYLALLIVLWLTGTTSVKYFVLSLVAANAAVAAVRIGVAAWRHSLVGPIEPLMPLVRDAIPFGMASLVSPLIQYVDKALLLYLLGTTELGMYTVALAAASVASSLAASASAISFGISAQTNDPNVFERVARVFRLTAWIWVIAGLALAAVIPMLLPLVYGAAFTEAVWPASLLIPAGAFAGQASVLEESLRAQGRAFIGLEARVSGMIVFVATGWFLAQQSGLVGVAIAYNAAQFVALAFMLCAARWHYSRASSLELVPRAADLVELWRSVQIQFKNVTWQKFKQR